VRTGKHVKVLIIGAGIGGLTLANLLLRTEPSIDVSLVERSSDGESAQVAQGGTLGLKDPGGLLALQRLGMYDNISRVSRPVANFTFLTSRGQRLLTLREPAPSSGRLPAMRVPRAALYERLLGDVRDRVRFGVTCTGYRLAVAGAAARYVHGEEEAADLLIAADGVKSAIRRQMIHDAPHYLGLAAISGATSSAPAPGLLAHGPMMVIGDGCTLLLDQDQESIGWCLTLHAGLHAFERSTGKELLLRVLEATRGWCPEVCTVLEHTSPGDTRPLGGFYDRDPIRRARDGTVVLLGDAAHPMSPFRGEGANMAMLDALSLAACLTSHAGDAVEQRLDRYVREMLPRSGRSVQLSRRAAREMHSRNPATRTIRAAKLRLADHFMR
jgi:salicylate hydroxylase